MAKGVAGARSDVYVYFGSWWSCIFVRAIIYEIGSYYSNYFMIIQCRLPFVTCAMNLVIGHRTISYFDKHQFGDLLGRAHQRCRSCFKCLATVPFCRLSALFTLILVIVMAYWYSICSWKYPDVVIDSDCIS